MSRLNRRSVLLSVLAIAGGARAQTAYPNRPIRIVVGFGAGGSADAIVRQYAIKMGELLQAPVVVENRPGANQLVAIRALQNAAPDGYTLYGATKSSLSQNPALRKDLGYDPLRDFSLIGMMATIPGVVFVNNEVPVKSIAELVAFAKANPGKLNYASAGLGSADHLAMEAFLHSTGTQMVHIPYKSASEQVREAIAGNVQVVIAPAAGIVPFIASGRVRALAVTAPTRLASLPEVPSIKETGVKGLGDIEPHTYIALAGPSGLPAPVVAQLNEAINKVSALPNFAARVRNELGSEPATGSPAALQQQVGYELARWRALAPSIRLSE